MYKMYGKNGYLHIERECTYIGIVPPGSFV